MVCLKLFLAIFTLSLMISPSLGAADQREQKENICSFSALPLVLLNKVGAYLTPSEVLARVRLVCGPWREAQGEWDCLRSPRNEANWNYLLNACAGSGPRRLEFRRCSRCSGDILRRMEARKRFRELSLDGYDLATDEWMRGLAGLNLERLEISNSGVKFTGAALSSLVNLKSLLISGCTGFCAEGLKSLAACQKLRELRILQCVFVNDDALKELEAACPTLREFELSQVWSYVTNGGMAYLRGLKELKKLTLRQRLEITDAGIALLGNLELDELVMCKIYKFTGSALAHLNSLKILHLDKTSLNDEGLDHLSACQSLQDLNITSCHLITDDGLLILGKMKNLQSLRIAFCELITEAGFENLRQQCANGFNFSFEVKQ